MFDLIHFFKNAINDCETVEWRHTVVIVLNYNFLVTVQINALLSALLVRNASPF